MTAATGTTTTDGTTTGTAATGQQADPPAATGQQTQQVDPSKVVPPVKAAETATGELSAQEKIAKLEADLTAARAEAGKTRVNAKEKAAQEAAEATKLEIGKLLGFVKDGDDADPAKLQQQIADHQSEVRGKDQELAVYRTAGKQGADPDKLLDSRSFLASIKDIDPVDTDKIAAAVKAAVDANETLKSSQPAAQVAKASGTATTGGSGEGAVTPEQFKAMGYDERAALFASNRALYDTLSGRK